jgi:putative ABC transport system permease protein
MAVESLRTNKMRSLLTVLGIVIGVMTVIGMVSVIQGLNRSFLQELASAGADLILVGKYDPVQMGQRSEEERRRRDLTFEDAMAIQEECPSVRSVAVSMTADIFQPIPVKAGNITSENAIIIGMNENWPTVYALYLPQEGRFLTESEISRSARSAILGFETAETLFPFHERRRPGDPDRT